MLPKSILITVRPGGGLPQGVRFAGSFFRRRNAIDITFLYILAEVEREGSIGSRWQPVNQTLDNRIDQKAGDILFLARQRLESLEFPPENIHTLLKTKHASTGKDILFEGRSGFYDAVLLGNRSLSLLEKLIHGDISRDIFETGITFPIWFCKNIVENRSNVLICLDGSPTGIRIVDHVGYILQNEPSHTITLLHVDKGQEIDTDIMFTEAITLLKEFDIAPDRIHTRIIHSKRVVHSILSLTEDQAFAAVAVGWSGRSGSKLKQFFVGSRSRALLDNIDRCALWIVP